MKTTQCITPQVIELGKVIELTLGTGIHGVENRHTPVGVFINKPTIKHN